jgi:hypothetical protein
MAVRIFMMTGVLMASLFVTAIERSAWAQSEPDKNEIPPALRKRKQRLPGIQIIPAPGFDESPFLDRSRPRKKLYVPIVPPPPPLPSRLPIPEPRLNQLINQLTSGDFRERVEATKILKQKGSLDTVERMEIAAQSDMPELSMRALSILEAIFLSEDDIANRAAEQALQNIALNDAGDLGLQASISLSNYDQLRSKRAIVDLQQLGLHIEFQTDIMEIDDVTGMPYPGISYVRLGRSWTGGEAGIRQISRLARVNVVYVIATCPVPAERVVEILEPINPEILIESRSAAELGIKFSGIRTPKGVMIGEVTPGKAANAAGLRPNDVIIAFGETEVNTSDEVINLLKKYEPGDIVKVVRARTSNLNDTETIDVKLKGW